MNLRTSVRWAKYLFMIIALINLLCAVGVLIGGVIDVVMANFAIPKLAELSSQLPSDVAQTKAANDLSKVVGDISHLLSTSTILMMFLMGLKYFIAFYFFYKVAKLLGLVSLRQGKSLEAINLVKRLGIILCVAYPVNLLLSASSFYIQQSKADVLSQYAQPQNIPGVTEFSYFLGAIWSSFYQYVFPSFTGASGLIIALGLFLLHGLMKEELRLKSQVKTLAEDVNLTI